MLAGVPAANKQGHSQRQNAAKTINKTVTKEGVMSDWVMNFDKFMAVYLIPAGWKILGAVIV
jgi:hypothetical protein